jgi:hypothetical protein
VSSSVSLLLRSYPRLKLLPTDDHFRFMSLLKVSKIVAKAALLADDSDVITRSVLFPLMVLSSAVLVIATYSGVRPLLRRPEFIGRGLARPLLLPYSYVLGFVWSKCVLVAVGVLSLLNAEFREHLRVTRLLMSTALFVSVYSNNEAARYLDFCKVRLAASLKQSTAAPSIRSPSAPSGGPGVIGVQNSLEGVVATRPLAWLLAPLMAALLYFNEENELLLLVPLPWFLRCIMLEASLRSLGQTEAPAPSCAASDGKELWLHDCDGAQADSGTCVVPKHRADS